MSCCCDKKTLKLFRNYPTEFADVDWLSIIFESEPIDLTNFEAKFALGGITREWGDITQGIIINLTDEETGTLPIGLNYGSLIVTDKDGNSKPFSTAIPIEVLDWVEGDQEIDTYNMTVNALLDNEVQMVIRIETAKVSLDWVNERIAEHNNSEQAHQYIQGLISNEENARQNADELLGQRITENTQRFNDYRTKSQQDVIDAGLRREIVDVNSNFSNYRTASAQDIIDNAQNYEISGKQAKLNTEQMDAVNSGITDIKVSSYDTHIANTVIHVTAQDKQVWNAKQNALNQQQLDAVNSGITDGYVEQITLNKNNISSETTNRQLADNNLQQQIDAITAASDVTDIVGTYAQLQAYDTSHLPNNSIIKVLQDESRDNETTYYRWVITGGVGSWVLIGEEGPYYTKSEANSTFVPQTRTVNGKALSSNISLNASDVGAVSSNQSITGATKCKITYDSKGLVTAGADLQASDIPDLSSTYATASQGAKADTAVQPADLQIGLDEKIDKGYAVNDFATNCITEIPQDIKLELNNGTLTLKAGSKVYRPDGNQYQTDSDKTTTNGNNGKFFVMSWSLYSITTVPVSIVYSGSTAPTGSGRFIWYDTTNNIIKESLDGGLTWSGNIFFPLAVVTVSNGAISSIDKVFNGFGYIGSTLFSLPDVKGLIPNGRNADGTLKVASFANTALTYFTIPSNGTFSIRARANYLTAGQFPYDPETNYNYNVIIAPGNERSEINAGTVVRTQGKITSFDIKPVSGLSANYINTALGYTPYNSNNPDGFITNAGIFYWGE